MTAALLFILVAVFWLAYANGANDNFKGVATLFGSGTRDYPSALRWATVSTIAGSLASLVIGAELVAKFSGRGLVPDAMVEEPGFALSVGLAAAGTVLLATRVGLPISTTHALVGGLAGAGLAGKGISGVGVAALGASFVAPLLIAPIAAAALTAVAYPVAHKTRRALGVTRDTCVCVGEEVRVVVPEPRAGLAAAAVSAPLPTLAVADAEACVQRYSGRVVGISVQALLDRLHVLSAGAVCFARGLNDTPKVVALLVTAQALHVPLASLIVTIAIAVGGLFGARRVAETMSHKITAMNHGQGFTANLATALLVIWASRWGLLVSTTHVSCGALFGIGAVTGQARWATIGAIALGWVVTLPVAAALAAAAYLIVG